MGCLECGARTPSALARLLPGGSTDCSGPTGGGISGMRMCGKYAANVSDVNGKLNANMRLESE